jgi:HK97 family phage portal protein
MGIMDFFFGKSQDNVAESNELITSAHQLYGELYGDYGGYFREIDPLQAYRLYSRSSVLGMAVHRIAQAISQLEIGLTETGKEFEQDADAIDVFRRASEGYTRMRLLYELSISFLLTNEAWLVVRGRPNSAPLSRTFVYPFNVTMGYATTGGLPETITTYGNRDQREYSLVRERGRARYLDRRKMNELIPVLGKETISGYYRGLSPLGHLLYDVQQATEGKRHNSSLLANGIRSSATISPQSGEVYDAKAMADMQAAMRTRSGPGAAGRLLIMPRPFETNDVGTSNRDMDYIALLESSEQTVFNFYGIPLPLMMNDASTFNNYTTAQTSFYDQAVFPVFDAMFDSLSQGLAPRFADLDRLRFTYNENTVRALTSRNIERMKEMRQTQALTTNEIREVAGYEPDADGDEILVTSALVPIGTEASLDEPLMLPDDDEADDEQVLETEDEEETEDGESDEADPDDESEPAEG